MIVADLAELDEDWVELFQRRRHRRPPGGQPRRVRPWEELERPNLDALGNVLHAAALAGVERVVFASSNHAMGGYHELGDMPITDDLPPRPGNPYGATKLMGERLGRSLAEAFDLTFVALRIGWVQHGENRPETLPDDWAGPSGSPTATSSASSAAPSRPTSASGRSSSSTACPTTAAPAGT